MLDNYFNEYEKLIMPSKHSVYSHFNNDDFTKRSKKTSNSASYIDRSSCSNKHSYRKKLDPKNQSKTIQKKETEKEDSSNLNSHSPNSVLSSALSKEQVLNYKKTIMFLRTELHQAKAKIQTLNNENKNLKIELEKIKAKEAQSCNHILMLEKMIDHCQTNIKTLTLSRANKSYTNLNTNKTLTIEKDKPDLDKDNLSNEIPTKRSSVPQSYVCNSDENIELLNEIQKLKKENESLKIFKEKIYKISTQNSEINEQGVLLLKEIINHFNELNQFYAEIGKENLSLEPEIEFANYSKIKMTAGQILTLILNDNKIKNEEYKLLVDERDEELEKVTEELNEKSKVLLAAQTELKKKLEEIEKLKLELEVYKNPKKSPLNKSNSVINFQKKPVRSKDKSQARLNNVTKTLNDSVKRIERIFKTVQINEN